MVRFVIIDSPIKRIYYYYYLRTLVYIIRLIGMVYGWCKKQENSTRK